MCVSVSVEQEHSFAVVRISILSILFLIVCFILLFILLKYVDVQMPAPVH